MKSILVRYILGLGCSLLLISGLVTVAYGQEAKFVLTDIKIAPESAETEMTFSADANGMISVEGQIGTVPDKRHPGQRKVLDNMFHDSAVHHFKGKILGEAIERKNVWSGIQVNISGYIFEGSIDQPLTFRCVLGKGYVYLDGTGTVTMKDGSVVKLGRNSPAPASTAASRPKSSGTQAKASIAGKWSGKTPDGISLTVTLSSIGDKTSVMKVGYYFPPMASEIEELSMDDDSAFATTDSSELSFAMPVLNGFEGMGGWYKVKLSWTDEAIKATLTKTDQPSTDYIKKMISKGTALIFRKGQVQDSYTISLKRKE